MSESDPHSSIGDEERAAEEWEARKARMLRPPWVIGAGEMLRAAEVETPFLVPAAVPAGAITLIVGEPGAKKSWLAYGLALAVAAAAEGDRSRSEWLGLPVTPQGPTGSVLVLNYDNPTNECGRRFKRLGMKESDPIFFHSVDTAPLRLMQHAEDVEAMVAALRPSLVVADSLRQSHESDENSSKEMADVMSVYKKLRAYNCAVVVVHHTRKGELESPGVARARGSSEISASTDAQIDVSRSGSADVDNAVWTKHRGWVLSELEETKSFEVADIGDRTVLRVVEGEGPPDGKKAKW